METIEAARAQVIASFGRPDRYYRDLFHYLPVGLALLDANNLVEKFEDLRTLGVTELSDYIDQHPEILSDLIGALEIEEVNQHMLDMFGGKGAEDMLGPISRYWTPSLPTIRRSIEARYRGEFYFEEETKVTRLDGQVIDVLFSTARHGASAAKSLVLFLDISQRRANELALRQAQERLEKVEADFFHAARVSMLGELTASIAHEVNQPLAVITINAEAALQRLDRLAPDAKELRKITKRIAAGAQRAAEIIERVRGMASRRAPDRAVLSLDEVIRESLVFLRHEIQRHGVQIEHHQASGDPRVLADRTQLQQVIVNLTLNAMQAMVDTARGQRRIILRTFAEGDRVCCTIADSGPGIEREHLGRIFESFHTTKDGGMGMGLSICRSIVEAHGGQIKADSVGNSHGAQFTLALPLRQGTA